MKNKKKCPKCFGEGREYNPKIEDVEQCTLCKGEGKVDKSIYYEPINDNNIWNINEEL
jgi:DnaJ-class molecular chaperone